MRLILFLAVFSYFFFVEASSQIETKLLEANNGDYIITRHAKSLSLLVVKKNENKKLVLEEICLEESLANQKGFSWQKWIESWAPGHTSWTLYEIDLENKTLLECFSISQNRWLATSGSQHLFSELLKIPFRVVPEKEQKRIGPHPGKDEPDHRSLWHPSVIVDGKKENQTSFSVVEGKWPNDQTQLAGCLVTLYYSNQPFPFPYWIEVSNGHFSIKMPIIDSGKNLVSPAPDIPHRNPKLLAIAPSEILLKCPAYYKKIELFAFDIKSNLGILIPFEKELSELEQLHLRFKKEDLKNLLSQGREYKWLITFPDFPNISLEPQNTFVWP